MNCYFGIGIMNGIRSIREYSCEYPHQIHSQYSRICEIGISISIVFRLLFTQSNSACNNIQQQHYFSQNRCKELHTTKCILVNNTQIRKHGATQNQRDISKSSNTKQTQHHYSKRWILSNVSNLA